MPNPDDLVARIEALNGRPLENRPDPKAELEGVRRKLRKSAKAPEPVVMRRDLPQTTRRAAPPVARAGKAVRLEEAIAGVEIEAPGVGRAFLVERHAQEVMAEAEGIAAALQARLTEESSLRRTLAAATRGGVVPATDLLFLDIETTGLSNTPLFLIGTMEYHEGGLLVRQYFARDYSEEAPVTALFLQRAAEKQVLVSFNGISFDLRYIRDRAIAHALRYHPPHPHLDLLGERRRVWGGRLPNCKLQTLEHRICGRLREDDIPGHLIPEAYHEYVRTGDARQMLGVLHHNLLDLVTMADLLARLG